jgi:PAS domain S-box-containing protein
MEDDGHRLLERRNAESAASARRTISIVVLGSLLAIAILILATALLRADVARRLRAEQALISSELRYRTLFENSPVGIYRTTPEGVILAANPALVKMLGYASFEELAARNLNTAGFATPTPRSRFLAQMDKQGEVAALESLWPNKAGEDVHIRENARAIRDQAGTVLYYEGTVEDITQQKRAEDEHARLVTAIEQSAEAVVITDPTGDVEYVNPAFTRITGYAAEEILGRNPRILKSGNHGLEFYQQLWETLLKGETWQGEIVNRRKNGNLYTEQMTITPVRGMSGEITHFIATKRDVTERKTLEEQVLLAAKMEATGRLAGGIAHDFNNLLTIISGYSEILFDKLASDPEVSVALKEIHSAAGRAGSLTSQLLAFSRRQVLAPQVVDLNSIVSNLEKMLKRVIGEDIRLHTVLNPTLGLVRADPGQIEQVIMNLAVNARDAMPAGGDLTIETSNVHLDEAYARGHVTVKPGPHVMLAVSDTGVGMTAETQAHVFEPFFTTKEQGKGTGLGLATVYGIVKQSGGYVWVYSELHQGAVFKVYLPTVGETPPAETHAKPERESASGSETILVVEDEEGVRSLIRFALETAGYKVLATADPESALATCANYPEPIHLLLSDVVMPKVSGPLVAEKVLAMRPSIKVLYMSGYTDDAVLHHGVLSKELPFIQKPFSPGALRGKIREVLELER